MKIFFILIVALLNFKLVQAKDCETNIVQLELYTDSHQHCYEQNIEGQFTLTKCDNGAGSLTNNKEQRILFKENDQWVSRHDQISYSTGKTKTEIMLLSNNGIEFTDAIWESSKTESTNFICKGLISH